VEAPQIAPFDKIVQRPRTCRLRHRVTCADYKRKHVFNSRIPIYRLIKTRLPFVARDTPGRPVEERSILLSRFYVPSRVVRNSVFLFLESPRSHEIIDRRSLSSFKRLLRRRTYATRIYLRGMRGIRERLFSVAVHCHRGIICSMRSTKLS